MTPLSSSVLCFGLLLGAIALGQWLRSRLPGEHLSAGSETAVRAAVGLLITLTSIVLGFTVGGARAYHDSVETSFTNLAAETRGLDRTLERLGPEAAPARMLLRQAAGSAVRLAWPGHVTRLPEVPPGEGVTHLEQLQDRLFGLHFEAPREQALLVQAQQQLRVMLDETGRIFELAAPRVQRPLVLALACWLVCIFLGLSMLAPGTPTAIGALTLGALAATGAILLTLEYYDPLRGLVAISPEILEQAFASQPPVAR
jgi:hypothetical protein